MLADHTGGLGVGCLVHLSGAKTGFLKVCDFLWARNLISSDGTRPFGKTEVWGTVFRQAPGGLEMLLGFDFKCLYVTITSA